MIDIRNAAIAGLAVCLALAWGGALVERSKRLEVVATLNQERAARATEDQGRERLARENAQETQRLQARHAARQQGILHAHYQAQLSRLARDRRDAAGLERLHGLADAYAAARGGGGSEGDTAACRSARAELAELTALLREGAGLVVEGRKLLRERDEDAALWHGVATNDRALTGP